jgi:peptidoglycan/LPS O-acetylase OafA/YrhL
LAMAVACPIYVWASPTGIPVQVSRDRWGLYESWAEWVSLPAIAVFMAALCAPQAAGGHGVKSLTARILGMRPLIWLGDVSLAVYMTHDGTIYWCGWAATGRGTPTSRSNLPGWSTPLVLAACVVVGALFHYAVEAPCRSRAQRWLSVTEGGSGRGSASANRSYNVSAITNEGPAIAKDSKEGVV